RKRARGGGGRRRTARVNTRVPALVGATLLVASAVRAEPPREWSLGPTGRGAAQWTAREGRLIYRGGATVGWALVQDAPLRDGFVQVRFRSIGGREDRAGGVIWRWRDPRNYYVARAHTLAGNVQAFRVVEGRRDDLVPDGGATDFDSRGAESRAPPRPGSWAGAPGGARPPRSPRGAPRRHRRRAPCPGSRRARSRGHYRRPRR